MAIEFSEPNSPKPENPAAPHLSSYDPALIAKRREDRASQEEVDRDSEQVFTAFQEEAFPPGYVERRFPFDLSVVNGSGVVNVTFTRGTNEE
ncbi:hypothetical protein EXS70_03745 [Candidatus Peribacteria bacterium]|nr:hypothetical protein [Candidatus Peribacteria bacterium]